MVVSTRERARTGKTVGILIIVVAVIMAVAFLDDLERDKELHPSREKDEMHIVQLQVIWADLDANGNRIGSDRSITITYFLDDVRYAATRDEEGSLWTETLAVPRGTQVALLVEEDERGGYKECLIRIDGRIALPGGYEHRNDAGDCRVEAMVP